MAALLKLLPCVIAFPIRAQTHGLCTRTQTPEDLIVVK